MLEYLDAMSEELASRRFTMEKNIRSGSSSFYPSYRSLCEEFTRYALSLGGIEVASKDSVSALLSKDEVNSYFESRGCPSQTVQKIKNYILKINKQVHLNEKEFDTDLVVLYINALFAFTSPFAVGDAVKPEEEEIKRLCRAHEREVGDAVAAGEAISAERFDELMSFIGDRFEKIESGIEDIQDGTQSASKSSSPSVANTARLDRNTPVVLKVLNNYLCYIPKILNETFEHAKLKNIVLMLTIIASAFPYVFLSRRLLGLYSTFTFLTHFWQVLILFRLLKFVFMKEVIPEKSAEDRIPAEFDKVGLIYVPMLLNRKYKVCMIISYVGATFDIIYYLLVKENSFSKPMDYFLFVLFVLLIVTMSVASAMLYYRLENFYNSYLSLIKVLLVEQDGKQYVSYKVVVVDVECTFEEYVNKLRDGIAPKLPKQNHI